MGSNTLNNRSAGQTIVDTFFNDIHQAMNADFVGRGATGVPTSGQNLGTVAIPWGTLRANSLVLNGAAVDTSQLTAPQNRIISGKTRSSSNQPAYIIPSGAAASLVIDASPTNLVLDINGTSVTISNDITKSSLTTAPSTQNTALVNDVDAADQYSTKTWGEKFAEKEYITIDTVGTNITSLVGKWAAFKIAGVSTEYFLAFVESGTRLSKCFRGYFYDSALSPINRTGFSNNDTITLMSLAWIFIENDATTVDVTYNNPAWSFSAPSSPVTGDYWYDLGNQVWKRYDGASFQIINRTYIGQAILDTTNCVAARSVDFYANFNSENSLSLERKTTEIVSAAFGKNQVSVYGKMFSFNDYLPLWNITTDFASNDDMYSSTEQPSRLYYLYLKDTGDTVISDISPYDRGDMYGYYHPHNPWRWVGSFYNDASSDITAAAGIADEIEVRYKTAAAQSIPASTNTIINFDTADYDRSNSVVTGANWSFTALFSGIYQFSGEIIYNTGTSWITSQQANLDIYDVDLNLIVASPVYAQANHSTYVRTSLNTEIKLNAGQIVYITTFQNTAGAASLAGDNRINYICIKRSKV